MDRWHVCVVVRFGQIYSSITMLLGVEPAKFSFTLEILIFQTMSDSKRTPVLIESAWQKMGPMKNNNLLFQLWHKKLTIDISQLYKSCINTNSIRNTFRHKDYRSQCQ